MARSQSQWETKGRLSLDKTIKTACFRLGRRCPGYGILKSRKDRPPWLRSQRTSVSQSTKRQSRKITLRLPDEMDDEYRSRGLPLRHKKLKYPLNAGSAARRDIGAQSVKAIYCLLKNSRESEAPTSQGSSGVCLATRLLNIHLMDNEIDTKKPRIASPGGLDSRTRDRS